MPQTPDIAVCCAGLKGAVFVEALLRMGISLGSIFTYRQPDDLARGFERMQDLAKQRSIGLHETRRPVISPRTLTFLVGWQHLLADVTPSTVVFHDSLLPRYRGFAPTVTALIKGDREIGVTALRPVEEIDQGPIIAQRARQISYPMKIETALTIQASLMAELAGDIIDRWRHGQLTATPQQDALATYSIWRDDADFEVDWSKSAEDIQRFVNAVGHPYAGARTSIGGIERQGIRIVDVTSLPDMPFEMRQAGKVWRLDSGRPIVVCGTGLLRIDHCRREDGSTFVFERTRCRLIAS